MEPVTHFLTGACIGRAGLNRKTAYAALAGALAAEAADLDIFWGFAGPVEELKHHRGITHTFWAVPVIAGVVVGAVWLIDRWRSSRRQKKGASQQAEVAPSFSQSHREKSGIAKASEALRGDASSKPQSHRALSGRPQLLTHQPIHWGWLYLTAFLAALSHILLDWTNNYGVRPFFPLHPHWYAGSFMFIAEPIIWLLFFLAFFMPWVLGLASSEIGARRKPFRGRGWAIFALAGMLLLGCWRWTEHARALSLLQNNSVTSEPVIRTAAEPYPVNPFRWHAILETPDFYQTAEINTRTGSIDSDSPRDVIYKPTRTPAVQAAEGTLLGRVYLDWGTWAVIRDLGQEPITGLDPPNLPPSRTWTTVEFTDLRFDYSFLASRSSPGHAPLGGWVYMVHNRDIDAASVGNSSSAGWDDAGEVMGGRQQK
jgi:inner membrane protein